MASSIADILTGDAKAWANALPAYQSEHILALLQQEQTAESVAQTWLTINGPANNFPFGGQGHHSLFYDKLVMEIEKLLCGGEQYESTRKKLLSELKPTHAYIITTVSVAVAPMLGAAAPLIAPAIAMLLYTAAQLGLNAWCATRSDIRARKGNGTSV